MELEKKHLLEKNGRMFSVGIIIQVMAFLLGVLGYFAAERISVAIINLRVILDILLFVVFIVLYVKFKASSKFEKFSAYQIIAVYAVLVFTCPNTYMYVFMYPVAIYIMFSMNLKLTRLACIGCVLCNLALAVKYVMHYPDQTAQVLVQTLIALLSCLIIYMVVKIQAKQQTETLDEISDQMDVMKETQKKIMGFSNELTERFEVAKGKADETYSGLDTTATAVSEISEGVRYTAEAIETQTTLTSDIQRNLENCEEETHSMMNSAQESVDAVKEGKTLIEKLSEQATLTGELNKVSQQTTQELNDRIGEVGDIVGEILNISSQTNLLALNASIEAARAGEAGRGFAVVADQIRQLSEQTKNSVEKITAIIDKLDENAKEAVENMSRSIDASELQNRMIEETESQMTIIEDKNTELGELMSNISNHVEDILGANTQITDSISNLSATSEQVSASSETCANLTVSSKDAMETLNELLEEIKVIADSLNEVANA